MPAVSDPVLEPGTIVAGRYRIVRTAGRGGMGVVYVVEHVNTGGLGALKIMRTRDVNPRHVERFKREARASAMVQSEHVVRVSDADVAPELDNAPFMVMELLDGEDLADLLKRRPKMDAVEVVEILGQVARGLERAHAVGVIHRDLKPTNIFLHRREDGGAIVKIVDFGISKIEKKGSDHENTGLTLADDLFGTPSWMSPEQASAMHHAIGPGTDIWAVGLLAFRMLHGDSYWGDREIPQLLAALMGPTRETPSAIDPSFTPAFDRWFLKSCAREPERRFADAAMQIEQLADALGVRAPVMSVTQDLKKLVRRDFAPDETAATGGMMIATAIEPEEEAPRSDRTAPTGIIPDALRVGPPTPRHPEPIIETLDTLDPADTDDDDQDATRKQPAKAARRLLPPLLNIPPPEVALPPPPPPARGPIPWWAFALGAGGVFFIGALIWLILPAPPPPARDVPAFPPAPMLVFTAAPPAVQPPPQPSLTLDVPTVTIPSPAPPARPTGKKGGKRHGDPFDTQR